MSITDELRREARGFGRYVYTAPQAEHLTDIADRIDAEHEKQLTDARADGIQQGIEVDMTARNDHGWMKLPVDADGVPILAGDVMDGYGKTIEVVELRYGRSGWVLISRDGNGYHDTFAFTHHHAPTVEDVLREFGDWYAHTKGGCDEDGIIAEYAAKLRLAGEEI